MSERSLKQTILEYEADVEEAAEGDGPTADTCRVLLAWARGEEIDPGSAARLVKRAEEQQ